MHDQSIHLSWHLRLLRLISLSQPHGYQQLISSLIPRPQLFILLTSLHRSGIVAKKKRPSLMYHMNDVRWV